MSAMLFQDRGFRRSHTGMGGHNVGYNASMTASIKIAPHDALIIVDVQNDFLPGGSLAVPAGDQVIAPLNRYIQHFAKLQLPIFATRDWHPANHCSFRAQGGPWPPHCIAGSAGAAFAAALQLPDTATVISKAREPQQDAYSGFGGTDLAAQLRASAVQRVFVGGLATDYCVLNTVNDALALEFQVYLLRDAIRAVNVHPNDGADAEQQMRQRGAVPIIFDALSG